MRTSTICNPRTGTRSVIKGTFCQAGGPGSSGPRSGGSDDGPLKSGRWDSNPRPSAWQVRAGVRIRPRAFAQTACLQRLRPSERTRTRANAEPCHSWHAWPRKGDASVTGSRICANIERAHSGSATAAQLGGGRAPARPRARARVRPRTPLRSPANRRQRSCTADFAGLTS